MNSYLVAIGRIKKPHGLCGELSMESSLLQPSDFNKITHITFCHKAEKIEVEVEQVRGGTNSLLLKLQNYNTIESVEGFRGWQIKTQREFLPSLPKGEFYQFEIVGLRVVNQEDGALLGVVSSIMETGANDVYIVKNKGKELLIPAIKEVVRQINIESGEMHVSLLEGMSEDS